MRVLYLGHLDKPTGYGRAARDTCMALLRAGVDLVFPPNLHGFAFEREYDALNKVPCDEVVVGGSIDWVIVHDLPEDCARQRVRILEQFPDVRSAQVRWAAFTTWETYRAPAGHLERLEDFDQIWTPSEVTRDAISPELLRGNVTGSRFKVLPHCFDESTLDARRAPWPMAERPGRYAFYWIGAWTGRKNPMGLIRAFTNAFTNEDEVELILHSPGSKEALGIALAQTGVPRDQMPKVSLLGQWRDEAAMIRLHRQMDCFVTASRGEAWNLPAFEAVLAGRHVIAPVWQGSDDFLTGTSAWQYGGQTAPAAVDVQFQGNERAVAIGAQGISSRGTWFEPNLFALANKMIDAYHNRITGLTIDYDLAERFGYAAVGRRALSYLSE